MIRAVLAGVIFLSSGVAATAEPGALPDPLLFNDGQRVATADSWPERRAEIAEMLLKTEYGRMPAAPTVSLADVHPRKIDVGPDGSVYMLFEYALDADGTLPMRVHLYLPDDRPPPFPVIVRFGPGPEHAPAANARGYAFACFEQTLLDPDTEGYDEAGPAQAAYPEYDWGSLSVWAWSASRVMDLLETRTDIDTTRSVVTGHSRTGKAALLAGALDERFAVVAPNGSGAGGAALYRGAESRGAETLKLITRESRFKSWFHADFGVWSNREEELPFDQHFLRALVAPRVVLNTDAFGDKWAHPKGAALAWAAAQPVFDMLGASKNNLIHVREGGHDQLAEDFAVLLDVADAAFADREYPSKLRIDPFAE